jgi:hypothetical protein
MGMDVFPVVLAVFFDGFGELREVQKRSLCLEQSPSDWYDPEFQAELARTLHSWQEEVGFEEEPITVKSFFLKDYRIGIQKLPVDCQAFMDNPSSYSQEDQEEFRRDIERWMKEGNFVFWWSENYHLNRDGEDF